MEIEHRKYIIERLDKIDVTEVLIELRTALRKGLLDKAPVEVEYKERFISKKDKSNTKKEVRHGF